MRKSIVLLSFACALLAWQCTEGGSPTCLGGKVMCGGVCVSLTNDSDNCGMCGNACPAGYVCISGGCTQSSECTAGLTSCGGICVDTKYNPNNCGSCGHSCQSTQYCNNGACTGGSCPAGQTDCPGAGCVDLRSNPANCGSCGNACTGPCYDGACQSACPTGLQQCSGRCVDTQRDNDNCGACGTRCPTGQSCQAGACKVVCPTGQTECSGSCVNTQYDPNNCGRCANVCGTGSVCVSGACRSGDCPTGLTNCSGGCVDTSTDEAHCGRCDNACAAGTSCVSGSCGVVCPAGQTLCGGTCVTTATDEANCGRCGNACRSDQVCEGSACTCPGALDECGGTCVDTAIDPDNCGRCDRECTGSEACVDGSCSLNCPSGLRACNGYCVDTTSDRNNCGRCNNVCATDKTCTGGACVASGVCAADSCSSAINVTGGGRFTGTTACAGNDYQGSCGGSSGRDVVFTFTTTATKDVFISTHGSAFDTVVYIRRGTCGTGSDVYCNDDEHGIGPSELTINELAAGTYYVFLDGYMASYYGAYVFDIYMTDPSFDGDRCGDPEFIDIATATTMTGDTCPWYWFDANADDTGCAGASDGKDRLFYFVVTSTTNLTFSTCTGTSWDSVLYLRSVCNRHASQVQCNDDACGSDGRQSRLTATGLAPGVYYLWLDGYNASACGGYTLTISH